MYEVRCKWTDEITVKQEYGLNNKKQEQESKYIVKQWNSVCVKLQKAIIQNATTKPVLRCRTEMSIFP